MQYKKKVLLVLEESFETDTKCFASNSTWGYFAISFLKKFEEAYIYVPLENVSKCTKNNIFDPPSNVTIVGRPHYRSYKEYYSKLIKTYTTHKKLTENYVKKVDIVIVRAPSQISNIVVDACKKYNKKLIVVFAGNFIKASQLNKDDSSYIKSFLYRFTRNFIEKGHINLAKESQLMILYGNELEKTYSKYNKKYIFTNTPTIYEKELFLRKDTCEGNIINIIRVGSYIPLKGYETLIKAIKRLKKEHKLDVILNTFGSIDNQKYYQSLLKLANVEYINLNPPIQFGEQLFSKYKKSDMQVITSISEAIPRTIVEGASFSLPLIATNVGGISTNIKDKYNGLLIEEENVDMLVNAILTIVNDSKLRQKIIKNGFDMASNMTIENISAYIAEEINNAS